MSILDRIVADTRAELRELALDHTLLEERAREACEGLAPHRFRHALETSAAGRTVNLIAEIKSASPSAGPIVPNPDVETIAASYRHGGAAAISTVVEPRYFSGSRTWMSRAAAASGLPVLMKDFVVDPVQILRGVDEGASAVLLIAAILEPAELAELLSVCSRLACDALVEVHDEIDLDKALAAGADIVGVNNRNLADFSVDLGTSEQLSAFIPPDRVKVTESGIHSRADVDRLVEAGFRSFLVGESLLRQEDRTAAVRRLVGEPV